MATRHRRWYTCPHFPSLPTSSGLMPLWLSTPSYPDAVASCSMQMVQSWRISTVSNTDRHLLPHSLALLRNNTIIINHLIGSRLDLLCVAPNHVLWAFTWNKRQNERWFRAESDSEPFKLFLKPFLTYDYCSNHSQLAYLHAKNDLAISIYTFVQFLYMYVQSKAVYLKVKKKTFLYIFVQGSSVYLN